MTKTAEAEVGMAATAAPSSADNDILGPVAICTPEIVRLAETVAEWIRRDHPGGAVYGKQRNGKSWGSFYVGSMIGTLLGYEIGVVLWNSENDPERPQTKREFFQERMLQARCYAVGSRDLAVLKKRLYDHLEAISRKSGSKRMLLVVDEAHTLDRPHFVYLIHIFNELERRGLRPFFLLVGQPDLRDVTDGWMEADGQHVIGRFFARELWFRGIAKKDFEAVLGGFDQTDEEEGTAAVQRQLPEAWERGFRLAGLAGLFGEALDIIVSKHGLGEGLRLPMQYLRTTVLVLLRRLVTTGTDPFTLSSAHVLAAIRESGFIKVLMFYAESEPERDDLDAIWSAAK